jgi:DNA primase
MPGIDYRALRCGIGLAAVLDLLAFAPQKRRGDQVRGPCPIHAPTQQAKQSFSAHLRRNAYRCFYCGSAGNQLDLCAAVTRQPLYQAAIELCEKLNHPVPWLPGRETGRETGRTKSAPAT